MPNKYKKHIAKLTQYKTELETLKPKNWRESSDEFRHIVSQIKMIIRIIYTNHKIVETELFPKQFDFWTGEEEDFQRHHRSDITEAIKAIDTIVNEYELTGFKQKKEKTEYKSWQDYLLLYIIVGVVIIVIGYLITKWFF